MPLNRPSTASTTLDELLSYHDERFIYNAYHTLLGRAPDAEGLSYYLARLRSGIGKVEILAQIRLSTEGKSREIKIPELDEAIRRHKLLKTPFIGMILRITGIKQVEDGVQKKLNAIEKTLNLLETNSQAILFEIENKFQGINKRLNQHPVVINQSSIQTNQLKSKEYYPEKTIENKFDADWYLEQNPDVAASGNDPYEHYMSHGKKEGRHPAFDSDWYLSQYPDVAKSGVNPREHYINYGKAEGRHPAFDRNWYLTRYPDIAASDIDPFDHYVQYGKAEGRHPAYSPFNIDRNVYPKWIREFDTLTDGVRATLRTRSDQFNYKPLVSIVMPVYNPNPAWLEEAVASVHKQIYLNWELCIADDASTDPAIRPILEHFAKMDNRIKIVFREQNGHISAASNSALELAQGEWIALLDHDDILSEHALFWVVEAINQHPDIRLIYSDEDKIDEMGVRSEPYFKCDWNPDLFYSQNMISHLGVYHADLVREVGEFRTGLEGSQDYDLALRCIEHIAPRQVHHIARVLYHWRIHENSTAQDLESKPYAMIAGARALNEHFERQGVNARVELVGIDYRVRYALPESLPLVSLIIPTRNGLKLLQQCVESILAKTSYNNYEILIVDNGSDDPLTLRYLRNLASEQRIRVIRDDRPFNYSALNNAAIKLARGEIIGLINNDIEVITPDWLSEMVSHALRPEVGAVGAKLLYQNDTIQHAGVLLGISGLAGHAHKNLPKHQQGYIRRANLIQSFSAVTAACLVIRKSIYESLGGLNETDLQVAFNDVDFCIRVREAGYRNIWTPYAELYHHESSTRGYEDSPKKQARFAKEAAYLRQSWGDLLLNDPAYSPNLTLDHEDFSLAWPPRMKNDIWRQETPSQKGENKFNTLSPQKPQKHYLFLTYRMALGYGVDVVVSNVVKNLLRMGYQVTIGCFDRDDYYNNDMDIRLLNSDPKNTAQLIEIIGRLIEDVGVDCVIAHTWPFFEILPHLNSSVSKWAWEHGDPTPEFFPEEVADRRGIKERKSQYSYPVITGVIAISEFIRHDIQWPSARIIHNGCDHVPDLGSKGVFDFDLNLCAKLKVGTLMRLGQGESYYKGNDLFLEIAKRCYAQNISAQFYVMGRGTPEDAAYFQSIGIETYLNAPDNQKWDYLRKLDMFFSPSLWEGCNLPLLEAQASGTLGFAFDTGAHPEVTPFIISSIDEAVALIKRMSTDRSLLLEHSLLSYRFVRTRFSWKESTVKFLQITEGIK